MRLLRTVVDSPGSSVLEHDIRIQRIVEVGASLAESHAFDRRTTLDLVERGLACLVEDLSCDCGEEGPGVAARVAVPGVAPDQDPGLAGRDQLLVCREGTNQES